jgi:hypothetical protein
MKIRVAMSAPWEFAGLEADKLLMLDRLHENGRKRQ